MRDIKIKISLLPLLSVLECTIEKEVNYHGSAKIVGHIEKGREKELMSQLYQEHTWASVWIIDEEGKEEEIFAGIVKEAQIRHEGGLRLVSLTLTGSTFLLDCQERTRTFQNAAMTYDELLSLTEKEQEASHIIRVGGEKRIGDIVVQYQESNWEFIRRMASRHHSFIIPYYKGKGIRYYIGLDTGGRANNIEVLEYSMNNNIQKYIKRKKNGVEGLTWNDAKECQVTSRDYIELGSPVMVHGEKLYVYRSVSHLKGAELVHTYLLRTVGGFSRKKEYNKQLIGASLEGHILASKEDKVKVCLTVDGTQDKQSAKWFAYSTVYSSPDGSGWYCMPEEKDRVRLYFPNEKEEEGYIISSIHENSDITGNAGGKVPRTNPDYKSISNKYGKQLELTPNSITMTNNQGMSICLDDEQGISIISDKDVVIQAGEKMSLISLTESMSMEAKESIKMKQGNAKITIQDEIKVEGALMKVQ